MKLLTQAGLGLSFRFLVAILFVGLLSTGLLAQKDPDPNFTLKVNGPTEALRTGAEFDVSVTLDALIGGIDGWSLGVEHDPAVLELLDARLGITSRTANDGAPPEYLVLDDAPEGGAGVTLGAILSIEQTTSLDAGNDYELLTLRYKVVADPETNDPCEPIESSVWISGNLGSPAKIPPRVSVEGQSSLPVIEDLPVSVRCPGGLEIIQCEGGRDTVDLAWQSSEEARWDFFFLYRNGELVDTLPPEATSYQETNVPPGTHNYTLVTFIVEEFGEPIFLFSQCSTVVNPVVVESVDPQISTWIGGETITITGQSFEVPQELTVTFSGVIGGAAQGILTPVNAVTVDSDTQITIQTPEFSSLGNYDLIIGTEFGDVVVEDTLEVGFIRGEVNSDGTFDLSDSVYIFEYLFLGTVAEPRCMDSADANNDGVLDISDAALLLAFQFLGTIEPAPPHPGPGQDTEEDDLGCLN